jgi:hypothetical protein
MSSMRQPPLGKHRARGVETLDRRQFEGNPGSLSGSFDQVLSVIRGCNEALGDDHPRVVTLIVVDHVNDQNNGTPHLLKEQIPAIPPQIVNVGQQTRFMPVELFQSCL